MKKIIIISILCFWSIISFAQIEMGSTTDYTKIEQDGTLEFHGDATVWNDYVVPFSSVKTKGVKIPSWESFMGNIYQWAFEDKDKISDEQEVGFVIQLPHDWDGSTIYPHIHWSPEDNNSGSVVWAIEYTWVKYDETTPLAFPATTVLTATGSATNNGHKHLIAKFPAISPTSSQNTVSSLLVVTFYRNSTASADTYKSDAFALSFDIHYRINTIGSREEYVK